ncbi:MAG: hypothetical protein HY335_07460, partial [Deinococcus sp.]|nr:hypothetical protein [Deinococcus sp.]
ALQAHQLADGVVTPQEYLRFVLGGPRPEAILPGPGVVLRLGGGIDHARRLGRRLGYAVWAYAFDPLPWRGLRQIFVASERQRQVLLARGAPPERVMVVGNLVADALAGTPPSSGPAVLLLLSGSRRFETEAMLPYFLRVAELLAPQVDAELVWLRSALLSDEAVARALTGRQAAPVGGVGGAIVGDRVVTAHGTVVRMAVDSAGYSLMRRAALAITIPGTNTLELGIAGVPAVVVLPLYRPARIPVEGPLQWVGYVPLLGPVIKGAVIRRLEPRLEFVSLANKIAGEALHLELRGLVAPEQVAAAALKLWQDEPRRQAIARRLADTMPRPGAAQAVAQALAAGP